MHTDLYDVIVVGAGLVGSTLIRALASQPLRIALIEAHPQSQPKQLTDDRALALSISSKNLFQALGLWQDLASHSCPIKKIHISNQGHFGFARLSHQDIQYPALGYVIGATPLSQIIQNSLTGQSHLKVYQPAELIQIETQAQSVQLRLKTDTGIQSIKGRLLVMADGGNNRNLLPLAVKNYDFKQAALITNVQMNQAHQGVAYERFTDKGPLALLPLNDHTYGLVWTLDQADIKTFLALDDSAFLQQLQQQFGWRAGQFIDTEKRSSWLLQQQYMPKPGTGRILCIGNAAHKMHPVAGQGLNLGLRDVAVLAQLLTQTDLTMTSLVQQYLRQRIPVQKQLIAKTTLLVNSFSNNQMITGLIRNVGLLALDHSHLLKTATIRYLAGLEDSQSPLLRGLSLNQQ